MSDVNELLIQPLQKFSKDSMHLIKKCTKPDRKGKSVSSLLELLNDLWGAARLVVVLSARVRNDILLG